MRPDESLVEGFRYDLLSIIYLCLGNEIMKGTAAADCDIWKKLVLHGLHHRKTGRQLSRKLPMLTHSTTDRDNREQLRYDITCVREAVGG